MGKPKFSSRDGGALFLLVISAFHCWAQFSSAIEGTVTDPSGAVVANARINRLYASVYRTSLQQGAVYVYPAFNVTNPSYSLYSNLNEVHTLSPVNGDLASSLFGRSTSSFPARSVQFGLRFEF